MRHLTYTIACALLLGACDTAQTSNPKCSVRLVGVQPGAALVGPGVKENPHLQPWAALETTPACTAADIGELQVQLYDIAGQAPMFLGNAQPTSWSMPPKATHGCVTLQWAPVMTPHAGLVAGTKRDFAVVVLPPAGNTVAIMGSAQVPNFEAPSVLPIWNRPGEGWGMELMNPLQHPACEVN